MSYTTVDLVRHHLATAFPIQENIYDQPVVLESDNEITFFSGPVTESSVQVKSIQSNDLRRMEATLSSGGVSVASSPLVRGSVVIASDSSLGTMYTENVDYVVNYKTGDLFVKSGGDLSAGMTVVGWFQEYVVYTNGQDYHLDAARGKIRRLSGGSIAVGETVFLNYTPLYQSHTEEVLNNAVLEANHLVEREIDPDSLFGADPILQAVATYRALSIICRVSAARELSSLRGEDRSALAWIKLADVFAEQSSQLLGSFRPPFDSPAAPVHS